MVRKTKEEALETRNLILDAAETVFGAQGVSSTSLNEVARAAGMTRGAIYWHFKNKADLFNAMLERVILPMEEFVFKADDESLDDPVSYIRCSALRIMDDLTRQERTLRVFEIIKHKVELTGDMLPAKERQLSSRQQCISNFHKGFDNAKSKGLLPESLDSRSAAIGLHCLIDGLISTWVLAPQNFDLNEQAKFAIDHFMRSLQTTP